MMVRKRIELYSRKCSERFSIICSINFKYEKKLVEGLLLDSEKVKNRKKTKMEKRSHLSRLSRQIQGKMHNCRKEKI